jgi:inner membrane protein
MVSFSSADRSPTSRLIIAIAVAFALVVPIFLVWSLIYDRQQQAEFAAESIAAGWGGPQVMVGPVLVIPYRTTTADTVIRDGVATSREFDTWEQRTIVPETVEISTGLRPERRARSIYEAIVYEAEMQGIARFAIPPDIQHYGVDPARLDLTRAELRFGLADPRGLGANPQVSAGGAPLRLQPVAGGSRGASPGFFAWLNAAPLAQGPIEVRFSFSFRGNGSLALVPKAGDTKWTVASAWPHPSFQGGLLPAGHEVSADGFRASYRVGNLALGQLLVSPGSSSLPAAAAPMAQIDLIQPVDLYSQVVRATKYGFLFIGFTFLALLLFDIVGGVPVGAAEYLLVGAGLVLFFVLLLAFAEVIGFAPAYFIASAAITGLIGSYSAAVLRSWRRAGAVFALMTVLYGILYLLLSLEAFSLIIGSVLLFAALAAIMYLTRHLDWGGHRDNEAQASGH